MSIKIGIRGISPNWLDIEWTPAERLKSANAVMAFTSRDWSITFNKGDTPDAADPEKWAVWCLITSDTKKEALETWWDFCDEVDDTP